MNTLLYKKLKAAGYSAVPYETRFGVEIDLPGNQDPVKMDEMDLTELAPSLIELSDEQFDAFWSNVAMGSEPNAALKEAAGEH